MGRRRRSTPHTRAVRRRLVGRASPPARTCQPPGRASAHGDRRHDRSKTAADDHPLAGVPPERHDRMRLRPSADANRQLSPKHQQCRRHASFKSSGRPNHSRRPSFRGRRHTRLDPRASPPAHAATIWNPTLPPDVAEAGHTRSRSRTGLPYARNHECGSRPESAEATCS